MTIQESRPTTRFPREVVRRIVDLMAADTLDVVESSMTEPSSVFTDPDRFAREQEILFRRSPHVIGWSGEVKRPGSFITRNVAGVPVVVTRDEAGVLHAFRNACTHRGAQVAQGCGEARRLTCPYHAWSFDLSGRLAGQPEAWAFDDIDSATLGLSSLPVTIEAGLIVVGLEDDVVVDGALADIAEELAWCGYDDHELVVERRYDVACNWKIAFDVNLEVYHVASLHRQTLHPLIPNNVVRDSFGRHGRHAFPMRSLAELVGLPEESWPPVPSISVVHTLFPSCVVLETPVSSQMFRIYPGRTPGECVVELSEASARPTQSDEERAERVHGFEMACYILKAEDFPAAEQCQRGAESGMPAFRFGQLEPMLQHWHRTWNDAIA